MLHFLLPLLALGILAGLPLPLALVRTIALFEPTFLTAGPTSQTLVVAPCHAVSPPACMRSSRSTPWR